MALSPPSPVLGACCPFDTDVFSLGVRHEGTGTRELNAIRRIHKTFFHIPDGVLEVPRWYVSLAGCYGDTLRFAVSEARVHVCL
jgi:hypothetical protein